MTFETDSKTVAAWKGDTLGRPLNSEPSLGRVLRPSSEYLPHSGTCFVGERGSAKIVI